MRRVLLASAMLAILPVPPQPQPADTRLFHVVVSDDHGQDVHGIPAEDFFVAVDGVEQTIVSAVERTDAATFVVIFVDDAHLVEPENANVTWLVRQFTSRLLTGARIALVQGDSSNPHVQFAENRELTNAAADTIKLPPLFAHRGTPGLDDLKSLDTLDRIAGQFPNDAPGRSAIVWLTQPLHKGLLDTADRTARALSTRDVTLYAVNPALVTALRDELLAEPNRPATLDLAEFKPSSPGAMTVRNAAVLTGGFAVQGGNITGGLTRVLRDLNTWYDVTIAGSGKNQKPHSVTVGVKREGLVVRSRHDL